MKSEEILNNMKEYFEINDPKARDVIYLSDFSNGEFIEILLATLDKIKTLCDEAKSSESSKDKDKIMDLIVDQVTLVERSM